MINIIRKEDCCGCSACVQRCPKHCISMTEDEEGFLYPIVNLDICNNCKICESVCPIINKYPTKEIKSSFSSINQDETIRNLSSSGGVFTLLSQIIIDKGGVVFGACWNGKWEVEHGFTETYEGLSKFRGSKYLQSRIGNNFIFAEQFLKEGRFVLFSGTPCQISGLKHFLRKDYDHLLCVDIVCHGVPSPSIWKQYLDEVCDKHKSTYQSIETINFRDKSTGWNNYSFSIKANGWEYKEIAFRNPFMRGFLHDIINRPSCTNCPAKPFRSGSDITIGDFWGVESILPNMNDGKGVSLVLVNNKKGMEFIKELNAQEIPLQKAIINNPAISQSSSASAKRDSFFSEGNKSVEKRIHRLCKTSFSQRIKNALIRHLNFMFLL